MPEAPPVTAAMCCSSRPAIFLPSNIVAADSAAIPLCSQSCNCDVVTSRRARPGDGVFLRGQAQPQFGSMPAARMTPAHFGSSRLISAATSSGVALDRSKPRSEEHTSELQSHLNLVCRLLLEKKKKKKVEFFLPHTWQRSTVR